MVPILVLVRPPVLPQPLPAHEHHLMEGPMQKFRVAFLAAAIALAGPVTVAVIAASGLARAADANWHLYVDLTGVMAGRYEIVVDPPYTSKQDCDDDAASEDTAQDLNAILHMAKHLDPGATVTNLRCEQGPGAPL